MDPSSFPDIAAMLMLVLVLGWLRTKYRDESVDWWLLGLFFILVEDVAFGVYRASHSSNAWMHALALDAYLFASVTFGWAARKDIMPGPSHLMLFIPPIAPMLALINFYGLRILSRKESLAIGLASLIAGCVYIAVELRRHAVFRKVLLLVHLCIWVPLSALAWFGQLRFVVYWALTCMYMLVVFSFWSRIRRDAIGGIVIVTGFTIWAGCFFIHPLVHGHAVMSAVVGQIWSLQKFLVTVGMLLTMLEDETDKRKAEAMHDSLTGLPNRRLFEDRLEQAMERSRRAGKGTALFLLDLNDFKSINDLYGHAAGDKLLCLTADALSGVIRNSDTLARCGGDEFCLVMGDLAYAPDCEVIAAALRNAVAAIVAPFGTRAFSASVGYAVFPDDAQDQRMLYVRADEAMYRDKHLESSAENGPAKDFKRVLYTGT